MAQSVWMTDYPKPLDLLETFKEDNSWLKRELAVS
jgi:hypothetical protein